MSLVFNFIVGAKVAYSIISRDKNCRPLVCFNDKSMIRGAINNNELVLTWWCNVMIIYYTSQLLPDIGRIEVYIALTYIYLLKTYILNLKKKKLVYNANPQYEVISNTHGWCNSFDYTAQP